MKVYRYSYDGIGVYEALKQRTFKDGTWNTLKSNPNVNWLPVPNVYAHSKNVRSYFTPEGMRTFETKTMPLIWKYLDGSKIQKRSYDISTKPVYKDKYQIVV